MSETAEQAEQTDDPQAVADAGTGGDDSGDQDTGGDSEIGKVRKEAASYRRKLRDAEAERDKLAARITDYDRAEVERQVAGEGGMQSASDIWAAGVQLDDLRDDEGGLDPEKIKEARTRVLREHPHWRKPLPDFDAGARQPPPEQPPSFGEALKKAAG